jgi:hypothetical protein
MSDSNTLTPAEIRVRDFLKTKLGDRATITGLHADNGITGARKGAAGAMLGES